VGPVEELAGAVVVEPVLARLEALDHLVTSCLLMAGRMLIGTVPSMSPGSIVATLRLSSYPGRACPPISYPSGEALVSAQSRYSSRSANRQPSPTLTKLSR
jgi:hypothetical protein